MKPELGLRERKKMRTRAAIQREALRLFKKQGYEETTIAQIAAAADISESTFFNYFESKAEVVYRDDYDPQMGVALMERPGDEPVMLAIRRMLTEFLIPLMQRDRDLILLRSKISLEVPELRALIWSEMEKAEDMIRHLIAHRTGRDPEDYDLRIFAGVVAGGFMTAVNEWVKADGNTDIGESLIRALDVIEAGDRLEALQPKG